MTMATMTVDDAKAQLTIGLLGVEVPEWIQDNLHAGALDYLRDLRLAEIERRILALEASAIEAQRAEITKIGSVHESAAPSGEAPNA
jgi:hypothetical protein